MPRSVYYYQLSASNKTDPYWDVKAQISLIYHRHKGRYGYRRVQAELGHRKHDLNPKTVQKLMGNLGLKSTVRPKRYQSYKGPVNRYQYSRHFPTSLGTAVQILPEKVHCYNYGA